MTETLKYESVRDRLLAKMEAGELPPGSRLKNELDMAREYGVSAITIRRAMADLVLSGRVVRKRGAGTFVAEAAARAGRDAGGQKLIAMLLNQESYGGMSLMRIIEGAQKTLNQHGAAMLIDWNSTIPKISAASIDRMLQQGADGFLIYPFDPCRNRDEFRALQGMGKPYVLIDRRDIDMPAYYAGSDNFRGGMLAANELLSKGHEKICFVAHLFFLSSEQERYAGFSCALRAAGVRPCDHHLMEKPDYDALARLIRGGEITALFCVSDRVAERTIAALLSAGLRVPEDVSVVGHDDAVYMPGCPVPISTVRQHFDLIGRQAAELALWAIAHPEDAPGSIQLLSGVEFVPRESVQSL